MVKRIVKISALLTLMIYTFTSTVMAAPANVYSVNVPEKYGKVTARWKGDDDKPLVIQVEDAHASTEAQANLAGILHSVITENDPSFIGIEGGSKELDVNDIKGFSSIKARNALVSRYMQKNLLSGVESAAILSPNDIPFIGLEDESLFKNNLDQFNSVKNDDEKLNQMISDYEDFLTKVGKRVITTDSLTSFIDAEKEYIANPSELAAFLPKLIRFADMVQISHYDYPILSSFIENIENDSGGIDGWFASLDIALLKQDIESISLDIKLRLSKTEIEKTYVQVDAYKSRLSSLLKLELTSACAKDVLSEFEGVLENISDLSEESGILFKVERLKQAAQSAAQFYRSALERDNALVSNHLNRVSENTSSVIVSGGFHTDGITKRLREKGVSYVTITPNISKEIAGSSYIDRMRGNINSLASVSQITMHYLMSDLLSNRDVTLEENMRAMIERELFELALLLELPEDEMQDISNDLFTKRAKLSDLLRSVAGKLETANPNFDLNAEKKSRLVSYMTGILSAAGVQADESIQRLESAEDVFQAVKKSANADIRDKWNHAAPLINDLDSEMKIHFARLLMPLVKDDEVIEEKGLASEAKKIVSDESGSSAIATIIALCLIVGTILFNTEITMSDDLFSFTLSLNELSSVPIFIGIGLLYLVAKQMKKAKEWRSFFDLNSFIESLPFQRQIQSKLKKGQDVSFSVGDDVIGQPSRELSDIDYLTVAENGDVRKMKEFIQRAANEMGLDASDSANLNGFAPWYTGSNIQSLEKMQFELFFSEWVKDPNGIRKKETIGNTVPLSAEGYQKISGEHTIEVAKFIMRVIDLMGKDVSDFAGFRGFVPLFSRINGPQNFDRLKAELENAAWIKKADTKKSSFIKTTVMLMSLIAIMGISGAINIAQAASEFVSYNFAEKYDGKDIFRSEAVAKAFVRDYFTWEQYYFQNARNQQSGLTYDGFNLCDTTGIPLAPRAWSAPSKECLDISILVKVIAKNENAILLMSGGDEKIAISRAIDILSSKVKSYREFYKNNPGYGGFIPWFVPGTSIVPTDDWEGEIPGLDNGEWIWSLLAVETVLKDNGYSKLAKEYADYNAIIRDNVVRVFYDKAVSKVRGDSEVLDTGSAKTGYKTIRKSGRMTYLTAEHGVHEGMMLVMYMSLFGQGLSSSEISNIWSGITMRYENDHFAGTTWQGYWGSSHEEWAWMFLPLMDMPEFAELFRIRQIIRTQDAVRHGYPGFPTSTNKPGIPGYLDGAGIDGINLQPIRNNHVFAIYGAFPVIFQFAQGGSIGAGNYGLVWLHNMLKGPNMQGPFGAGESSTHDGKSFSPLKTADGSHLIYLAMMGGINKEIAKMMREQGVYEEFVRIMRREYNESFAGKEVKARADFSLPQKDVGGARKGGGYKDVDGYEIPHFDSEMKDLIRPLLKAYGWTNSRGRIESGDISWFSENFDSLYEIEQFLVTKKRRDFGLFRPSGAKAANKVVIEKETKDISSIRKVNVMDFWKLGAPGRSGWGSAGASIDIEGRLIISGSGWTGEMVEPQLEIDGMKYIALRGEGRFKLELKNQYDRVFNNKFSWIDLRKGEVVYVPIPELNQDERIMVIAILDYRRTVIIDEMYLTDKKEERDNMPLKLKDKKGTVRLTYKDPKEHVEIGRVKVVNGAVQNVNASDEYVERLDEALVIEKNNSDNLGQVIKSDFEIVFVKDMGEIVNVFSSDENVLYIDSDIMHHDFSSADLWWFLRHESRGHVDSDDELEREILPLWASIVDAIMMEESTSEIHAEILLTLSENPLLENGQDLLNLITMLRPSVKPAVRERADFDYNSLQDMQELMDDVLNSLPDLVRDKFSSFLVDFLIKRNQRDFVTEAITDRDSAAKLMNGRYQFLGGAPEERTYNVSLNAALSTNQKAALLIPRSFYKEYADIFEGSEKTRDLLSESENRVIKIVDDSELSAEVKKLQSEGISLNAITVFAKDGSAVEVEADKYSLNKLVFQDGLSEYEQFVLSTMTDWYMVGLKVSLNQSVAGLGALQNENGVIAGAAISAVLKVDQYFSEELMRKMYEVAHQRSIQASA